MKRRTAMLGSSAGTILYRGGQLSPLQQMLARQAAERQPGRVSAEPSAVGGTKPAEG